MSTEETLRARIAELESQLAESRQQQGTRRERIAEMSSEVVDSNPYSRLMALKRMGIVENYEKGTALLRVLLRFHNYMSAATRMLKIFHNLSASLHARVNFIQSATTLFSSSASVASEASPPRC